MMWQPIETAPRDGTAVLCFRLLDGKPEIKTAYWRPDREAFGGEAWSYFPSYPPTHWMPLPEPPEKGPMKTDCHICFGRGFTYGPTKTQPDVEALEEPEAVQCSWCRGTGKEPSPQGPGCAWVEQQEGDWHTACGQGAYDDPIALELTYCAYCGRRIESQPFKEAKK
jgi:hypothetical protein